MHYSVVSQTKEWLLPAYVAATWPWRRVASALAARWGRHPLAVVYYHRIADHDVSPWTMTRGDFARQIHWLRENFELISLAEVQRRIQVEENRTPAVCITFDDGYADNCVWAIPFLLEQQIPFTYFVSTDFVRTGKPFPHDQICGLPSPPNTIGELRAMATAGIDLGAHTRSHTDLGAIADDETLRREIAGSKEDLEQWTGHPVRSFAFPFGHRRHMSPAAFRVAYEAGLTQVCSAYGGYNWPGDDSFHLLRIHGDNHFPRFRNWLTMDPRLCTSDQRYDYGRLDGVAGS